MIHTDPNPTPPSHGQDPDCPISAPDLTIHNIRYVSPEYDASLSHFSSFPGLASTNRFISLCSPDGETIPIIYAQLICLFDLRAIARSVNIGTQIAFFGRDVLLATSTDR